MKYKDFKTLTQGEMKGIKGGNPPVDNPCSKCCTDATESDCTACYTGLDCKSGAVKVACAQNPNGTCPID